MTVKLETERLIFREFTLEDTPYLFQLDSNEKVQQYCEQTPFTSPTQSEEIIQRIIKQYETNGIGRWMVFLKQTNQFIGWAGLKIEQNVNQHETFIDLGFRILPEHWNQGYMTEAAKELVRYGFEIMRYEKICAYILPNNPGSIRVVEKAGLEFIESFVEEGQENYWYELSKDKYLSRSQR